MNSDEINLYFYDDLNAFLQEKGQAKVQVARQRYLEDLVENSRLNTDLISSWSRDQRIELLPHYIASSSWCNSIELGILDLYESVPKQERRSCLQRRGYDLSDLDNFIQSLQKIRVYFQKKREEKGDEPCLYSEKLSPLIDEARKSGINFRLSYLERNQGSDFLFCSGLLSSKDAYETSSDRSEFILRVAKIVDLDEELMKGFQKEKGFYGSLLFKKAEEWYNGQRKSEKGDGVKPYLRDEFGRAFDFLKTVDSIIDTAQHPELLRKLNRTTYDNEFSQMSKEYMDERSLELFYLSSTSQGKEKYWLELLKAVDSDEWGYLSEEKNSSIFQSRIKEFRKCITEQEGCSYIHESKRKYNGWKEVEEVFFTEETFGEYVLEDLRNLQNMVRTIDDVISQKATEAEILEVEKSRVLSDFIIKQKIEPEGGFIKSYFKVLAEESNARRMNNLKSSDMSRIQYIAERMFNIQPEYLTLNPRKTFDTIFALYSLGDDQNWIKLVERGNLTFDSIGEGYKLLISEGMAPTSFLVKELHTSGDKARTLDTWCKEMNMFSKGNFDSVNELHRNLEYTRFRRIVEHEKIRRHIKNHFTFEDYLTIFKKQDGTGGFSLTDQEQFEVDCVAHEAILLRDYIFTVKEKAKKLGREVVVVPNLSYGYLPVSSLVEELEEVGIETIIGVKVGSTECHSNREVLNSRLFKGHRTEIANKQSVVIVVDGTYNLVTINNRNAIARYPDAHQGYLNQVIALNEAMGFTEEDYSQVGKSSDDVSRLRGTEEFKRAVDVYKRVLKGENSRQPYQFQLWNTAGMELAVRGNREIATTVRPYDGRVEGPAMIFCNVGVLDEQIPEEIKARFESQHKPAYFDDSGKIIAFDFGFDNFGVHYLNRLETEVKRAYDRLNGREERAPETIPTPAIIGYAMRNLGRMPVEEIV
ncbi:hypothetical protein HYX11_02800 [Candidatus Woesearchaeota archaeon]|nr:hypothetical protein [Candidatus Woesearchaeota archaeon]